VTDLALPISCIPKKSDLASTIADELAISARLADLLQIREQHRGTLLLITNLPVPLIQLVILKEDTRIALSVAGDRVEMCVNP